MSSRRGPAPSNVDLALEAIRAALVAGRLRPGERIKEIPLAEQLGFSRAPIRDALRLLERDGLIELVPNRGRRRPRLRGPAAGGEGVRAPDVAGADLLRCARHRPPGDTSTRAHRGQTLHEAIVARDVHAAERLWREKFERWIRDLVGRLEEDFDDELWVALTRGAGGPPARASFLLPPPG